ncbi:TIGR00282 family metallophosphoesterase [[Acholeplasma] multilocale]|uniref:TIGR00282 family metallophosphoesterase n=1 Tax=[Acholeplasma] multilocale TaxID=264638 RepID=UPI00047DCB55|nr:TIGR00282 family metallophosphoesterase [[Acholeplasma] multilocale]
MKVLMIGDVYAKPGRDAFENHIKKLVINNQVDVVIVNGENTTHGKSIIKDHYDFFKKNGVDVITSGNHIFKHKSVLDYIDQTPDLLRPMNMNAYMPGKGYVIINKGGKKICVVNLMGTSFMDPANNPYEAMDNFLDMELDYDILLVDFHAEATAEKMAFAWNYDGIITGFVGTHTHVQTADERILPKGTAFITDLGMTGVLNSIIGAKPEQVIYREKTGLPARFEPAAGAGTVQGVIITIDNESNRATAIKRIQR